MSNWAKINPFIPQPTTSTVLSYDVEQPRISGLTPTLTSSHDGFVWLKQEDLFYSENFAYTPQTIVTTGTTNSSMVVNVVGNSRTSASSYAFHVQSILISHSIADDFPLVAVTG